MIFRIKLAILFYLFFINLSCFAQKESIKFGSLGIKNGLSQSSVNDIVEDKKGFLWFATQDGLNRYDGYKFVIFKHNPSDSNSISDNFINCLFLDKQGNLWAGTEGGLNKYNSDMENFTFFPLNSSKSNSLSHHIIKDIAEDGNGNLWIATMENGLKVIEIKDKKVTVFKHNENINSLINDNVLSLITDRDGNIWIGTEGEGINKYDIRTKQLTAYHNRETNKEIPYSISNLCLDVNGKIWIGAMNGVFMFNPNKYSFETPKIIVEKAKYNDKIKKLNKIYQDKSGMIWLATAGNGLFKIDLKANELIWHQRNSEVSNGINSNIIISIFEDRTGNLWFGSNNGLNKFDRTKQNFSHIQHVPNDKNSLTNNIIWSVIEASDGVLWVGTDAGLNKIDRKKGIARHFNHGSNTKTSQKNEVVFSILEDHNKTLWIGSDAGLFTFDTKTEKFSPLKNKNTAVEKLNRQRIYSFLEDRNHNLWIGTKNGLFVLDKSREKILECLSSDKLSSEQITNNVVRSIKEDRDGNIWIATNSAGLNSTPELKVWKDSINFTHYSNQSKSTKGINNNCLYFDINGLLWIGSYGGGLYQFDTGTKQFKQFTEADGLANNVVYGIQGDNQGYLWLSTNKGLSKFNLKSGKFQNYYESDGLQSDEFNTGAHFKGKNGELFFGGINGLNTFNPSKIQINSTPPKVIITELQIFNKKVRILEKKSPLKKSIIETQEITLTHKQGVFTFEYAALHYSAPDKNSYAFIMEGFDEDWNYVAEKRQASYTNLDPGEYVFKVKAANSDGIWSSEIATLNVTVLPPYWKTWWFRSICVFAVLGLFFGISKARINVVKAQKIYLEKQVRERTYEILDKTKKIETQNKLLENEKGKVEKLLLNMLPQETVEELKTKGKASARHYRTASIMFTDFKGFTQIAEKIRPKDLVSELDYCFIKFDEIIEKYNIEKIKTIGDSYMCAGGLPVRNKSNPIEIVLAALDIQRFMVQLRADKTAKGEQFWELRIGINTGELIAGVVGIKRLAYDIWGDSVNVANRMEMQGEVGKVNISGTTYKHIKYFFDCTYRGKILAKNKGEVAMYFVNRIMPELSADEEGTIPNKLFQERLHASIYSKINYYKMEKFIIGKLQKELPDDLLYHGLSHTLDVRNAAETNGISEGISGDELILLKTAALFHDSGFIKTYLKNEPVAAEFAKEFLPLFGYSESQIQIISDMIMATQIPQSPKTLLEEILCDADLDYLGRGDFYEIADTLKEELLIKGQIKNDLEWDKMQIKFLEKHSYFTKTAMNLRSEEKEKRLEEIKKRSVNLN